MWYSAEELVNTNASYYSIWDADPSLRWYPVHARPEDLWATYHDTGVYNPHAYHWDDNPGYREYSHHAGETTDWQLEYIRRDCSYLGYTFLGW